MDIRQVIEKLLNRDSMLNLLENDIIEKFEVVDFPDNPKLLVIKMFLNTTDKELFDTNDNTPRFSEWEVKIYDDYRELLLNNDIDAVVISLPDHQHAVTAVHSVRAGKHVYLQKLFFQVF